MEESQQARAIKGLNGCQSIAFMGHGAGLSMSVSCFPFDMFHSFTLQSHPTEANDMPLGSHDNDVTLRS